MEKSLLLFLIFGITACATSKKPIVFGNDEQKLAFIETHKNLGEIKYGEKLSFEYVFTNTGKSSITLLKAVPTCGCVVVELPSTAIEPGNTGKIKTVFDSDSKTGLNKKSIVLQTTLPYPNDIIELSFEVIVRQP